MHVCHVITRLIIGGAQENTILTCKGLAEMGHKVTLIAGPETGPEGSLWDSARALGFDLVPLDSLRRAIQPASDLRALKDLRSLFCNLRPDVVHTHSSKAGILGRAAAAAEDVPVIVHTIHGMSFNRTQPLLTRTFFKLLEQWSAMHTTEFIAVAEAMTAQAVAADIAPRESFTVIRSGLDTDLYKPCAATRSRLRRDWGASEDQIVVGTIARLFDNKGYDDIIAALPAAIAACPRLLFVWVGDGPRRTLYERRLAQLGLRGRVRLLGLLPPEEIPHVLSGFDILLHASRWEGLPRAIVQALLMQTPPVTFDVDGAPEVVEHGKTGLLVPLADQRALADAVVDLARNPELRRAIGVEGRRRLLETFDWRRMVCQIDALYRSAAASRHRSF